MTEQGHIAQREAKEYLALHKIEKIVGDMLNALINSKDEKPLIYMIKYLSSLCSTEELAASGITISGTIPKRLPVFHFPNFQEASHPFLKNNLTEVIWRELRALKTRMDGRLANCIVAGIENPSQKICMYACDPEAYFHFKKLFDLQIQELHPNADIAEIFPKHNFDIQSIDWGKLDRISHCIKYFQLSGARNIDAYPFQPLLDPYTKNQISDQVQKVFSNKELEAVPISKISEEFKRRLEEEGLFFTKHPSIEAIVPYEKWAEGVTVMYSKDLSTVIWINAEEHTQFYITQNNEHFKEGLNSLFELMQHFDSNFHPSEEPHLGFVTTNPGNLGTTLKMRTIIKLNKSSDIQIKLPEIQASCAKRGVGIKHLSENTYEAVLAQPFQTHKSECDIVSGFIESISELLANENMIILAEEQAFIKEKEEAELKRILTLPVFGESNSSLIKKFITEDIWKKLRPISTSFGFNLENCIGIGLKNHPLGINATDSDCYVKYEELFEAVIKDYFQIKSLNCVPAIPSNALEFSNSLKTYESISNIKGGYILWQGNLGKYSFTPFCTSEIFEQINNDILRALDPFIQEKNIRVNQMKDDVGLAANSFFQDIYSEIQTLDHTNWPENRLVLAWDQLKVLTNVLNHIGLGSEFSLDSLSSNIHSFLSTFEVINKLVGSLIGWTEKFGYFSTLPSYCGNGLSFKLWISIQNSADISNYSELAGAKRVQISKASAENELILSHKDKFISFYQSIIDVLDVAQAIFQEEKTKAAASVIPMEEEKAHAAPEDEALFPKDFKGAVKNILSSSLFNQYKSLTSKTSEMEISADILLKIALENSQDPIGWFCEGNDSFETFLSLYAQIIKFLSLDTCDLALIDRKQEANLAPIMFPPVPEKATAVQMDVSRNIEYPFPPFATEETRNEVFSKISSTLESIENFPHGKVYQFSDPEVKDKLNSLEIKLDQPSTTGLYSNWPINRGIFISDDSTINILINVRDHLRIIVKVAENNVNEAYQKLTEVHNLLNDKLHFAMNSKYGFLCSDLPHIGTGGFSLKLSIPPSSEVAGKEKSKINPLVSIVRTPTSTLYKGRTRYSATELEMVQALYASLS